MTRFSWKSYLFTASASLLTVFLALFASGFAVAETFSLTVGFPLLLRLCLLSALVSALVYALPRASLRAGLTVLLCGLLALYVWWRWDSVFYGAQVVFHQISYTFHEEIPSLLYYEPSRTLSPGYQRQAVDAFFSAAVPLLALWLGPWLTLRWPVWPAVGATAALWGLPLLILRQPGAAAIAAFLLFLALVILSRTGYRENSAVGARRVLTAAVPTVLALALLGTAFPAGFNPRPRWVDDLRLTLQRIPTGGFTIGIGGVSPSEPGKQSFQNAGPLNFDGHTVLQINSSSAQNPLFLRGFSAGRYTSEGWEAIEDPYPADRQTADDNSFLFPYLTQPYGNTADTIRITDMGSNTHYYYLPYYPSALPQDAILTDDAYLVRPGSVNEYHISFLPQGTADVSARRISPYAESEYRDWVYRNYLEVPYSLLSSEAAAMLRTFASQTPGMTFFDPGDTYDHAATVQYVHNLASTLRDYLASFTEYDQKTPLTPEGEDFVSWFLTESHRGYCLHYASAATLMFRACGVPARYAAGYVARPGRAHAVTNVPDRNAHAWVEVYIDGFGWQPVDVTPGFSGGGVLGDPNAVDPESSPSSSNTPDQPSATPAPSASPTPKPDRPDLPTDPIVRRFSSYLPLLYTTLGLLLAGGAILLQRRLRLSRLCRRCVQADPNRAAVALYRYLLSLRRRANVSVPPEAVSLAQKAWFSQHTLTGEECAAMEAMARAAAAKAESAPLFRRLLLKYLWALV